MEDMEDYDDRLFEITERVEKDIKKASRDGTRGIAAKQANDGDKPYYLSKIKQNIDKMKTQLKYFKSEIYKIPRD